MNMVTQYIFALVAVITLNEVSAGFKHYKSKFEPPQRHWYHPPHHWHDCGSSEVDWDKAPRPDPHKDWNNGAWVYPDEWPRPPWPRPKPPPTPPTPPTSPLPPITSPLPPITSPLPPITSPLPPITSPLPPITSPLPPIPTNSPPPRTTPRVEDFRICMKACASTYEYKPVCGSDGVTYPNEGLLKCAQTCGSAVTLARSGVCDGNVISTVSPPTPSTPLPDVRDCISRCIVTPEYNPVCGSDGVTYANPGRLECAKACGVNVQLARNSRCPTEEETTSPRPTSPTPLPDLEACLSRCPSTPEYNPVCGSDGVTYRNAGRLACAKSCGVDVQLARNAKCPANMTTRSPNPTTPQPTRPTTSSNGLDFTISQDILDLIFTDEPDTTGMIDERFQDD